MSFEATAIGIRYDLNFVQKFRLDYEKWLTQAKITLKVFVWYRV